MRLARLSPTIAIVLVACSATSSGSPSPSLEPSIPAVSSTTTAGPPSSPVPSLPAGIPSSFPRDLPAAKVPPAALIPRGTDVAGTWFAQTSAGDAMVLAWQGRGPDPFRLDHGVVVWRRFTDGGAPWRAVFGETYNAAGTPVLGITATTQDVTGDGSEDALVFAETGGSGACGISTVLDLAAATTVYRRSVCDTQITPSTQPVGLSLMQAVYAPGDAHCCPRAIRETVLTFGQDGAWHTASSTTSPT